MRRPLDAYYTPEKAVETLRKYVGYGFSAKYRYFEPCVGTGNIIKGFNTDIAGHCPVIPGANWKTNDIDPAMKPDFVGDAADRYLWLALKHDTGFTPDWTVTNPPFNCALPIIQNAVEHSELGVAALLRLSFLEPTKDRGPWLKEHPPTSLIVLPRISFTGDGKHDSVTCAWMLWRKADVGTGSIVVSPKA